MSFAWPVVGYGRFPHLRGVTSLGTPSFAVCALRTLGVIDDCTCESLGPHAWRALSSAAQGSDWMGINHERGRQTFKNRILLENYFLPGDLEGQIDAFVGR